MTSRDFCYWLQGFFELENPQSLNERTTTQIKQHLALVFRHEIDPSIDGGNPKLAEELQAIHDGNIIRPPTTPTGENVYRC